VLAVTAFTLLVAIGAGLVQFTQLTRIVVREGMGQAQLIARQLYAQGSRTLARSPQGNVWEALRQDPELRTLLESSLGYSPHLQYVLFADNEGRIRLHGERAKEEGQAPDRPALSDLLGSGMLARARALIYEPGRAYEVRLPLRLGSEALGTIRLGVSTALLRRELEAAVRRGLVLLGMALPIGWLVAFGLARLALRPIPRIARAMEQARRGELTAPPDLGKEDEFRELAAQLELLGKEVQADRLRTLGEEGQLQQVADHLEDGLIFLQQDRRVLSLNSAAERVVGLPQAAARGTPLGKVLPSGHPLLELLEAVSERAEEVRNVRVSLPLPEGPREFLVSAFAVRDGAAPIGTVALLKDLGSLQTVRSVVSYSAKLAALGRLTSGVAHEVKNPLNAMAIHLELLKERVGDSSDQVKESVEIIEGEIQRLDRVVQGFLGFVRPQELHPVAVDVNGLLGEVLALLRPEWEPRGVRFILTPATSLPAIAGDAELLRQAFLNLLLNACQAMPAGGDARVTVTREAGHATVRISDEGVGVAPENLERIFKLYYTTKPEGSGMGLALAYRTVQLHDGTIEVQSEIDRGTTFTIRLPLE
jgi:signal transduction histidine kinase